MHVGVVQKVGSSSENECVCLSLNKSNINLTDSLQAHGALAYDTHGFVEVLVGHVLPPSHCLVEEA